MASESSEPQDSSADSPEPDGLLSDMRQLRRQARAARHAYWFPLVLFGLLICASVPFYIRPVPTRSGIIVNHGSHLPDLPAIGGVMAQGWHGYLAYYWLAAILVGLALTGLWYRRNGRRVGLVTPARGYLIASAVLLVAALLLPLIPPFEVGHQLVVPVPGDLIVRGTLPFVIIGLGLWVLARAERSWGLLAIAAIFTGIALLASLYNIENVLFRLGWNPTRSQWGLTSLPNVLLPALVLLIAGGAAYLVQRRQRSAA